MSEEIEKGNYKWVITGASFFLMALITGVVNNVFSIFIIPVTKDLAISRKSFSLAQTLIFIATILVTPFIGKLISRFGLIRIFRIFSLLTPIVYFGFVISTHIWHFYLISILLGACQCFLTQVPLSILLNKWFSRNIGLAIGIAFMGSGIGGMVLNPVVNWIIEVYNWRSAFAFLCIITCLIVIPISFFILKEPVKTTENKQKLGSKQKEEILVSKEAVLDEDKGIRNYDSDEGRIQLYTSKQFWMLALAFCLYGLAGFSMVNLVTPHFIDSGFSSYYTANIMALSMGFLAIGKVVLGIIYDKTNVKFATMFALISTIIGLLGLLYVQKPWAAAALFFGIFFGSPAVTISPALIARNLFKTKDFSKASSLLINFKNVGLAFCPFVGGLIFDSTGSYKLVFVIMIMVMSLSCLLFFFVLPQNKKQKDENRF